MKRDLNDDERVQKHVRRLNPSSVAVEAAQNFGYA